jgi:hypothetical protein
MICTYLGVEITSTGSSWRTKIRIHESVVGPIVTMQLKLDQIPQKAKQILEAAEMSVLRGGEREAQTSVRDPRNTRCVSIRRAGWKIGVPRVVYGE